jgi:sensor histidine kinase YesM
VNVRRRLLSVATWTIGGSFAATFAFSEASWRTPWRTILAQTSANVLFSSCCVTFCVFGLPWLVPRARRQLRFPLDWLAIFTALVGFGTAGSLLANSIGVVLGIIPLARFFATWYPNALKVSVYFTLIFGLSGVLIEELRGRLASTTLALRTKERDEADARRLAAEAQLASLEARVDPHFLFNTLNSIAALVRENPAAAERVIEQLAALMRSSLARGASLVTLDEELSTVRSYLEIERVRFGERLRFRIDADARAAQALVPRLSLQTLVENCVKYAVAPSREGADVVVRASASNDSLKVEIEDNGPGFDASELPQGHGLQLLRSRLAMSFGDRAVLAADSGAGRTCVTLELPLETVPRRNLAAPIP